MSKVFAVIKAQNSVSTCHGLRGAWVTPCRHVVTCTTSAVGTSHRSTQRPETSVMVGWMT